MNSVNAKTLLGMVHILFSKSTCENFFNQNAQLCQHIIYFMVEKNQANEINVGRPSLALHMLSNINH